MKIIVDAMSGDNAPYEIVKGAVLAAEARTADIILTGKGEDILRCIEKLGHKELPRGIEIANASEVISMEENPANAVRKKRDSSMSVGLTMLSDGYADAMVSAGSTGALLSGATLLVKRVRGVRRAALAPFVPTRSGGFVIIDCGANTECTPEYLLQFAFMGSLYAEHDLGKKSPRVGLLSNGSERTKGTRLQIETYELLEMAHADKTLNFIGNVEACDAFDGACDVLVCDGFSGNILLKAIEGSSKYIMSEFKRIYYSSIISKLSAFLIKGRLRDLKKSMDPERVGGTALIGISKPVIKAHGASNAGAIYYAMKQAARSVSAGTSQKLADNISRMKSYELETQKNYGNELDKGIDKS